jgi:hypothetical protein
MQLKLKEIHIMQIMNISKIKHRAPLMLVAGSSSSILIKGLWNRTSLVYELIPLNGGPKQYAAEGKLVYSMKGHTVPLTDMLEGGALSQGGLQS